MNDFRRQVATMRAELDAAYARVVESGWFILGKEVEAFESEMAAACGVRYAVGVGNGMDAIEVSLRAAGVQQGDEVITTPNSAFATALAIVRAGATPVFADIDPVTYALAPAAAAAAITTRTRAVLPVHIYGQSADLDAFEEIAARHSLLVIGDAAQAHAATYRGRSVAQYGRAASYSFYPTKNLGAFGDAGMIVTDDPDIASRARRLRDYGQAARYEHVELGLNSRLDELQAALLRVKLAHLPAQTTRRRAIARHYLERLADLPIVLPREMPYGETAWHLFVLRTPRRDDLAAFLKNRGVATLVHYPTLLPHQPALRVTGAWPVAEQCAKEFLSLPIFPELTDAEVEVVCDAVRDFFTVPSD